jgi:hypothetical protein
MLKGFYLSCVSLSMVFFLSVKNLPAADSEAVPPAERPRSPITHTFEALQRLGEEDRANLFRRMCSAVWTELSSRWEKDHKELFGGGVSDLFLAVQLKLAREFGVAEQKFWVSRNGKPTPQEDLAHLRVIADGLKKEIQAGKFDPKPEGQQAAE